MQLREENSCALNVPSELNVSLLYKFKWDGICCIEWIVGLPACYMLNTFAYKRQNWLIHHQLRLHGSIVVVCQQSPLPSFLWVHVQRVKWLCKVLDSYLGNLEPCLSSSSYVPWGSLGDPINFKDNLDQVLCRQQFLICKTGIKWQCRSVRC